MKRIVKIFKMIENYFIPPQCALCDKILEINNESGLCGECIKKADFCDKKLCCQRCGKPVTSYGKRALCYFCADNSIRYFDRNVAVFEYKGFVRSSVLRYKNGGLQSYAKTFAKLMAQRIEEEYEGLVFDFICAAPSHENKKRKMGFDHAELLGQKLSKIIKVPYRKNLLKETRETDRQAGLGMQKRIQNLRNSMAVADEEMVKDKTVLLVDDISTTRSTMIECSRALKQAGAKRVYGIVLATAVMDEEK